LDYDDENQLIRVTVTNSWKDEFTYDGKFRRRIEKDYTWTNSAWMQTNEIHFIYDGNVVIEERNTNNVPLVTYTRAGGSLLARSDHSLPPALAYAVHSYYHTDGNGNVTMLLNASQQMVAKYLYDPFGNTLAMSGTLANVNTYRFASKEWNAQTGFYYFGRRYYDPNLQRFVNRDPLAENGGLNLYGYCGNNPVSLIDIMGLCPWYDDLLSDIKDLGKTALNYEIQRELAPYINDANIYNNAGGGWLGVDLILNQYNPLTPFFNLGSGENLVTGDPLNGWGYAQNIGQAVLTLVPFAGLELRVASTTAAEEEAPLVQQLEQQQMTGPGASSSVRDTSGGLKGINTDVTADEFSANLQANGYTARTTMGNNGPVTILNNGQGSTYTVYTRTSTGESGAQYIGPNGQFLKYNLGK